MLVREILRVKGSRLYTVSPDQPLSEALAAMADHDIGSLAVLDGKRLVGVLTFREMLHALHRPLGETSAITVAQVMVPDPVTASPDMDLDELRRLMVDKRSRYLPVLDGEELAGIVSFHDVARAVLEEQSFENLLLKNYIRNWPEGEKSE
ncbi:CBS domain-containing protein [Rhodocyclus tenuis]|uniref:CBS domain-containing protein n=2 Tax=Rhodocyclus TaxID=1064 RepID=A0A6L5JTM7_RHOTE|nr:CBS domain-containing protein [Rhodocyclus gracilis]MQY50486.1 CBS domain-containing protein [Rhodocyclus gracilis]MRD72479.1 CBS domain-containing protein [Rhodocyclus gracilis]NJA87989.1 CBS domain-containing protein [Rhodocyclus gracilis]